MMPMCAIPRALPPPNATPTVGLVVCADDAGASSAKETANTTMAAISKRDGFRHTESRVITVALEAGQARTRDSHDPSCNPRYIVDPLRRGTGYGAELFLAASKSRRRAIRACLTVRCIRLFGNSIL